MYGLKIYTHTDKKIKLENRLKFFFYEGRSFSLRRNSFRGSVLTESNNVFSVVNNFFLTFGSCEEKIISGIHTENRLGVPLSYVDTLKFGPPAGLRYRHRVDHASAVHMIQ